MKLTLKLEDQELSDHYEYEAMGKRDITSDTKDYESPVEFSPNPPVAAGAKDQAAL
jgi:hypothetical protein